MAKTVANCLKYGSCCPLSCSLIPAFQRFSFSAFTGMSDVIISVANLGKKYPSGLDAPSGQEAPPACRPNGQEADSAYQQFVVYGIQSASGKIYIGQTSDMERRLHNHNEGRVRSTVADRPWVLVALQRCADRDSARWIEHQLKKSHGRRERWLRGFRLEMAML